MIELRTLGRIETRQATTGELLDLAAQRKCFLLLVYLAIQQGPVQRARLTALFWPELDESRARGALRQLLFRIKQGVGAVVQREGAHAVRVDRTRLRCDVVELRRLLREDSLEEALGLYEGDFMAGFHGADSVELEWWIEEVRRELLDEAVDAAWELTRRAQARGDLSAARNWARWALSRSPYDEKRLREYLLLLREAGEALEANTVYREFARRLEDELEVTPSPGTRRIAEEAIRPGGTAEPSSSEPQWSRLRVRSRILSQNTLAVIRRTSGIRCEHHAVRPFFRRHVERFLDSPCVATALVAPAGYGKTIGLSQAVEALWLGPSAHDSPDIVWFLQMRDLGSLAARGVDLPGWLLAQLGLGGAVDYRSHFRRHPEQRLGRMVLIIDGLDEHSLQVEPLDGLFAQLVSLIGSIEEPWFRVVLSMRTSAWQRFIASIGDAPAFRDLWYGIGFGGPGQDPGNVPPLTTAEVAAVVQRAWSGGNGDRVPGSGPPVALPTEILQHPFYLQLFLQSGPEPVPLDRLAIVEQFVQRRIHSPPHAVEKAELLTRVLHETGYGERRHVAKTALLPMQGSRSAAYQALISDSILVEEEGSDAVGSPVTTVRIGQPPLFEILIARHWIEQGGPITYALLEKITERYRESTLRLPILAWVVRYALRSGALSALEPIFQLPLSPAERRELARVLGYGLRRSDAARRFLVPRWARDPAAQTGYFETFVDQDYLVSQFIDSLGPYLRHRRDRQSQIFGHSLLFLGRILQLDAEGCHREAKRLEALSPDTTIHPLPLGRAMGYLLLYHHYLGGGVPEEFMRRLLRFARPRPIPDDEFRDFPSYHLFTMEALNLCGRYEESLRIIEMGLQQHPRFTTYRDRTTFHGMLLSHHALALLKSGRGGAAEPIVTELRQDSGLRDPYTYPTFHYSRVHLLWVDAEHQAHQADFVGAVATLRQVIATSQRLGFRFFEARALSRLRDLHSRLGEAAAAEECGRAAAGILDGSGFCLRALDQAVAPRQERPRGTLA